MEVGVDLLCAPTAASEEFSKPFKRKTCRYENRCSRFQVVEREYTRQYSHIYYMRLKLMGERVRREAQRLWGLQCEESLAELSSKGSEECCIVGTIFKQMELKPSILKEISAKNHLAPQPPKVKYVGASDQLILEDAMQRVILRWACPESSPAKDLVTGVVVGLRGRKLGKGEFQVEDICYPELPPPGACPVGGVPEDRYVLLMSGLNLGSSWCDQLSVEMMVDYVIGQLGGAKDQEKCSRIVRVIIAGDSITDKPTKSTAKAKTSQPQFLTKNYTAESLEAVKELDSVLTQLSGCVPVDLMSGSHDPTNHQLPQKPMHRCLFPLASQSSNLKGVSNPYCVSIDGISFLGCSGQNVNDIYRFVTGSDRVHMLENTLRWCHLSPTAPDTLACFPYSNDDPFIIEECPHVYFTGNQPRFQKKAVQINTSSTTLLICIPNFDLTHSCVLVNLNSLDCQEVKFGTSLTATPNPALERQREIEAELEGEGSFAISQQPQEAEMSILHHMDEDDLED